MHEQVQRLDKHVHSSGRDKHLCHNPGMGVNITCTQKSSATNPSLFFSSCLEGGEFMKMNVNERVYSLRQVCMYGGQGPLHTPKLPQAREVMGIQNKQQRRLTLWLGTPLQIFIISIETHLLERQSGKLEGRTFIFPLQGFLCGALHWYHSLLLGVDTHTKSQYSDVGEATHFQTTHCTYTNTTHAEPVHTYPLNTDKRINRCLCE